MSDHRPPAFFISGCLGLDFLNTLATPVDEPVDWIDDGDGLLAWLEQAGGRADALISRMLPFAECADALAMWDADRDILKIIVTL